MSGTMMPQMGMQPQAMPQQTPGQPQLPPQVLAALMQQMQQRQGPQMPQTGMAGASPPLPGAPQIPSPMPQQQNPNLQAFGNAAMGRPGGGQPRLTPAEMARLGQHGDSIVAHLTPGEVQVPPEIQSPKVLATLRQAFHQAGVSPTQFTAGSPMQSVNQQTQAPQFNWLDAILPVLGAAATVVAPELAPATVPATAAAEGAAAGAAAEGGAAALEGGDIAANAAADTAATTAAAAPAATGAVEGGTAALDPYSLATVPQAASKAAPAVAAAEGGGADATAPFLGATSTEGGAGTSANLGPDSAFGKAAASAANASGPTTLNGVPGGTLNLTTGQPVGSTLNGVPGGTLNLSTGQPVNASGLGATMKGAAPYLTAGGKIVAAAAPLLASVFGGGNKGTNAQNATITPTPLQYPAGAYLGGNPNAIRPMTPSFAGYNPIASVSGSPFNFYRPIGQ